MRHLPLAAAACLVFLHADIATAQDARFMDVRQIPPTTWESTDAEPRGIFCPLIDQAPTLDGKLDDAAWQTAGATDGFLKCDDNIPVDIPADVATTTQICRDAENIYVAWTLHGEGAQKIAEAIDENKKYGYSGRGSRFVTILSPPPHDNWLRWSAHPNGAVASSSQREGKDYDAPCETAAAAFDGGAIVEMAIPLSSPQLHAPKDGEWWRVQFGRVDNSEWTAWPNSRGLFEQPARYAYLYFGDKASFERTSIPVPPRLELYGERRHYKTGEDLTQFVAALSSLPSEARLMVTLNRGGESIASMTTEALAQSKVAFGFDLKGLPAGEYVMHGRVSDALTGQWPFTIDEQKAESAAFPEDGVTIHVHEQPHVLGAAWPITTGVPLPRGAVYDPAKLTLYENGKAINAQINVRSRWDPFANVTSNPQVAARSSLRWVSVTFIARYDGPTPRQYTLRLGEPMQSTTTLNLDETDEQYVITTGPLKFTVNKQPFTGIDSAWLDANGDDEFTAAEQTITSGGGFYLKDQTGTTYRAGRNVEVTVEEIGDVRIVLVAKGWYHDDQGNPLCLNHTRIIAYAGLPFVRVRQRTILTYDTRENKLADLGFVVPLARYRYGYLGGDMDQNVSVSTKADDWSTSLHQDRADHFRVIRNGVVVQDGRRSSGAIRAFSDQQVATEIMLRHPWQKFPKELELRAPGEAVVHFWPRSGGDTFSDEEELGRQHLHKLRFAHEGEFMDLQIPTKYWDNIREGLKNREFIALHESIANGMGSSGQGVAVANDMLIYCRPAKQSKPAVNVALFEQDPHGFADPAFTCATGALGPIRHKDETNYADAERHLNEGYLSHTRFFERFDSWGMWNHRDMFSFPLPAVNYPNMHRLWMSAHHQQTEDAWRFYARSGDPRWLDWARDFSDHFMNVDTCNYDDPDNPVIGTTPDGKHIRGAFIHIAGGNYHCKAYLHWGSGINAATHYVSPTTYLYHHLLTGDGAARDTYELWAGALNRVPIAAGASRDVNCTMAHVVPRYRYSGDPQVLLYIHRTGDTLMNTPLKDHSSGHYHAHWPQRYYDLTRDERVRERLVEFVTADSGILAFAAEAWRLTGDKTFLTDRLRDVIMRANAMYLRDDSLAYYSSTRPLASGSFYLSSLPNYFAALHEAGIPLALPPAEPGETKTLATDAVHALSAGVYRIAPPDGHTGPVALQLTAKESRAYHDYTGSGVYTTVVRITDGDGAVVLDTSIGGAMEHNTASILLGPATPAPWQLFIAGEVDMRIDLADHLRLTP